MAGLGINGRLVLLVGVVCFLAIIGEVGARGSRGGSFRGGYRGYRGSYYRSYSSGGAGGSAGAIVGIIFGAIGGVIALVVIIVLVRVYCCNSSSGSSKPSGGTVINSNNTARYAASPTPAATVSNDYHTTTYPYSTPTDYKASYNNDIPAPPSYEYAVNDTKGGYSASGGLAGYSADTSGGLPYSANPSDGGAYSYSYSSPSAPQADSASGQSRPIGFEGTPI